MSLRDDEVFQDLYTSDVKKKGRRKRSTDLMLTINLNERFETMDREQKQKFKDFAVSLFDKRKVLEYFKDKFSPDNPLAGMDSVDIQWKPEIGPKTGKLHLHARVAIEHQGFLTFQANGLREETVFWSFHLSCPVSSNERIKWENYVNKGFQDAEINKE
jgi:hypothetical protein